MGGQGKLNPVTGKLSSVFAGRRQPCLRIGLGALVAASLVLQVPDCLFGADGWHHPLYVGGGGNWHQRIGVTVSNQGSRSYSGRPVSLRIGSGPGAVDLAGADARAVRVVNGEGVEVLFSLLGPDGEPHRDGTILPDSSLAIPVECPPYGVALYWIYFDNPSAWLVPDFLRPPGLLNGGMEEGSGDAPTWWVHDGGDPAHRATWVEEFPRTGQKCLKLEVAPGAANSWISTRQTAISLEGGRTYTLRGWVRAENTPPGSLTGWYIHVATPLNPIAINHGLNAGSGTYDWREVSWTFTTPVDAVSASIGTMLWGTGAAWFDDVSLDLQGSDLPEALEITATPPESLQLTQLGEDPVWFDHEPDDDLEWDLRVPLHFFNVGTTPRQGKGAINLRRYLYRRDLNSNSFRVVDGVTELPFIRSGDEIFFDATIPATSRRTYALYFSRDSRIPPAALNLEDLSGDPGNLVSNPGFESGPAGLPSGWRFEGATPNTRWQRTSPGRLGSYAATFTVPHSDAGFSSWPGWRQDVRVTPSESYLYSVWVKLDDVRGTVRAHAHLRDAAGNLVGNRPYLSIGPDLRGTTDWTLLSGTFTIPPGAVNFQIHLSMDGTGTLSHDGVSLLGNVSNPFQGPIETKGTVSGTQIWGVPAVVKVFRDDPPPAATSLPEISAAGGEVEPLQLAVRSAGEHSRVRIEVEAPRHPAGHRLEEIEVEVVGYVPVAHTSDYYPITKSKSWERVMVTGGAQSGGVMPSDFGQGSDGWVGWWPDPLLPGPEMSLMENETQPVWLTVRVPQDAVAGDYIGRITLLEGTAILAQTAFKVHVWDFNLPQDRRLSAIYDVRTDGRFQIPNQTSEVTYRKLLQTMWDHRIGPDRVLPEPRFSYSAGTVSADYSSFDEAASFLLDDLAIARVYMPLVFYCFGWANPPSAVFGENPYLGGPPYHGADRSVLREAYKRAYQAMLRHFWTHLGEKGWQDRFVLYISDEPHYWSAGIIEQMKALCAMVHEVDPGIPIYSSVWDHVPAWDGYLDIWGIGQFGTVPPQQMKALQAAGDRLWFTTDGQMCIDTPYCAIERLLPHLAFRYNVEAYEFWGLDWLSGYDPHQFGWHAPVLHVFNPAEEPQSVVYPNGDGYLVYPGATFGQDQAIPSIRLAQAREGLEDYELLRLLKERTEAVRSLGADVREAERAGQRMAELVGIPGPSGRYSTLLLPEPEALYAARSAAGNAVESLGQVLRNPPGLPPAGTLPILIFPQFVDGVSTQPPKQGSAHNKVVPNRSRIILRNNSAVNAFGKLVFRDPAGNPVAVSIHGVAKETLEYRLDPWGSLDVQTDGTGILRSGVVELFSDHPNPSLIEGTLVYEVLGEFVSVPGSERTCFHRVYAGFDEQERAALALYNPSPAESIGLDLVLRDGRGHSVAHRSVQLEPLHRIASFLDEEGLFDGYFEGNPGDFKGVLDISGACASGFAALGLIQQPVTGALAAIPVSSGAGTRGRLNFVQFVNGEAAEPGTGEILKNRTRLILFNPELKDDSGTIRFGSVGGEALSIPINGASTDSLQYHVPGRGTVQITTDGTGPLQTGVATVVSDLGEESGIAGSAVLKLLGHLVSVVDSPARASHQAYVSRSSVENTGVALFNPGDQAVRLRCILVGHTGIPLTEIEFELGGRKQLARFVDEPRFFANYFESRPEPFSGTLSVVVEDGGAVAATSFLQKRSSGALITLPLSARAYGQD